MSKIISITDYWEEFYKLYPDPEPFREFISRDESLVKIYNFTAIPHIFENIKEYPYEEKLEDLKSISKEDESYLYDLAIKAAENSDAPNESHWLDFIVNLYTLVAVTLNLYVLLKKDGTLSHDRSVSIFLRSRCFYI
jgi:hypothetical protein